MKLECPSSLSNGAGNVVVRVVVIGGDVLFVADELRDKGLLMLFLPVVIFIFVVQNMLNLIFNAGENC